MIKGRFNERKKNPCVSGLMGETPFHASGELFARTGGTFESNGNEKSKVNPHFLCVRVEQTVKRDY